MIKQTPDIIKQEEKKKYVFKHVRSERIEGTDLKKQALIIVKSPSWEAYSDEAKKLVKKTTKK